MNKFLRSVFRGLNLIILFIVWSYGAKGQIIEGGTYDFFTCKGRTEVYTYYGDSEHESGYRNCAVTWTVTGGTITESNSTTYTTATDAVTGISQIHVSWTTDAVSGTVALTTNLCPKGNSTASINFQHNQPTLTAPSNINIGTTASLAAVPERSVYDAISWTTTAGGNLLSTTGPNVTAKPTVASTYTYTVQLAFTAQLELNSQIVKAIGCTNKASKAITVVVPPITNNVLSTSGPFYTTASNVNPSIINGSTAAGGVTTIAYQWQASTTDAANGFTNIAGATSLSYDPPAITQTTYYRRVCSSTTAQTSTSNVITIAFLHNNLIHFGSAPNFSDRYYYQSPVTPEQIYGDAVTGTGNTISYQWLESSTGSNWHTVGTSNGSLYTPGAITQKTYYAREAIIRDANGNIVFDELSNSIIAYVFTPVGNNTICCNQTVYSTYTPAQLTGSTPTGGNTPNYIYWESSTNGTTWTLAGTGTNFSPPAGQTGNVYYHRVVRDNSPVPNTSVSNTVTLNYTNTVPVGGNFSNPILTGATFDVNCNQHITDVNSLNGNFTNNYGGSGNDVYFKFNTNGTNLGILACYSPTAYNVYVFNSSFNLVAGTPSGCNIFYNLPTGTYYLIAEGNGNIRVNMATFSYSDCVDSYDFSSGGRVAADQVDVPLTMPEFPVTTAQDLKENLIYPNPASGELNIQFDEVLYNEPREIYLYDQLGRPVLHFQTEDKKVTLPIHTLPAAIYVVEIRQGTNVVQKRIVVK